MTSTSTRLHRILIHPWMDRFVGLSVAAFFFWRVWVNQTSNPLSLEQVFASISGLVLGGTLVLRSSPRRVTTSVFTWMIVLFANNIEIVALVMAPRGMRLVPKAISYPLATLALIIVLGARFNLGRNIGLVPARRNLVANGLYARVRHPIYAGEIIREVASFLSKCSWAGVVFLVLEVGSKFVKASLEEDFLFEDEDYRAYAADVRYRFFPFIH